MKDSVKDAVPATFPDCDLNPVIPVDLPPVPEPEFPECTSVSCPCVLVVSPQPVSNVISDLAKSWKAETREVNREELAEDIMFERLLNDLTGVTYCLMFPLTSTFNEECREELSPGIYGRKDVPSEVKARIRSENLFAIRMASLANKLCQTNKPWLIAAPAEINPSVFRLPEFRATFSHSGVTATRLDFAATVYENTTLLGNVCFSSLASASDRVDGSLPTGQNYFRSGRSSENYGIRVRALLSLLFQHTEGVSSCFAAPDAPRHQQPEDSQVLRFTAQLRGHQPNAKDLRAIEDKRALSGLRNAAEVITRLPGHIELGQVLARLFRKTLTECPRIRSLILLLVSGTASTEESASMSLELERLLLEPRQKLAKVLSCDDAGPISNTSCSTDIRANLLRRWAHVAQDRVSVYVIGSPTAPRQE